MSEMRADRLLTVSGIGTRSEVKKIIRAGRLSRNGEPVTRPETKLDPEKDRLQLDGKPFLYDEYEYWVLNKPAGILSATEDPRHRTVIDYMGLTRKGMAPCGRLDLDTEGFLLVTDDGAMVHRLLSPVRHVDKCYEVTYDGTLPEDAVRRFAEGIVLEDGTVCRPADLIPEKPAILTIREGKFHQVKRMFQAVGCPVTHLRRLSMGPLSLEALNLSPGEFRKLTPEETDALKQFCSGAALPETAPDPDGYEACIFDLDGTLLDSMWMWHDIDVRYLARFGLDCPEDLQACIAGKSFTETAVYFKERFGIPDDIETIKSTWEEMSVDTYRTRVFPKPGAVEFLKEMQSRGKRLGIATSNGALMVNTVLDALDLKKFLDVVVTACEVPRGKPFPDIYLKTAGDLGVIPEKCLVFEDIPEGIIAGKRAGMTVCAMRDEFSASQEPRKALLSDWMISDYRELL